MLVLIEKINQADKIEEYDVVRRYYRELKESVREQRRKDKDSIFWLKAICDLKTPVNSKSISSIRDSVYCCKITATSGF